MTDFKRIFGLEDLGSLVGNGRYMLMLYRGPK